MTKLLGIVKETHKWDIVCSEYCADEMAHFAKIVEAIGGYDYICIVTIWFLFGKLTRKTIAKMCLICK